MSSLLRTYTRSFERRPYITLCVANGILMSVGDISAQMLGLGVRSPRPFLRRLTGELTSASCGRFWEDSKGCSRCMI